MGGIAALAGRVVPKLTHCGEEFLVGLCESAETASVPAPSVWNLAVEFLEALLLLITHRLSSPSETVKHVRRI